MQMMDVVNKLLLPQANVMLSRRDSGDVNLPYDMERGLLLTSNPYNALKAPELAPDNCRPLAVPFRACLLVHLGICRKQSKALCPKRALTIFGRSICWLES
jgi:hypothetical protein